MKSPSLLAQTRRGSALVVVLVLIIVMSAALASVHEYSNWVMRNTASQGQFLRANAAAEAAIEVVVGRLAQWVNANSGFAPSIHDCATVGVPGNSAFPAIAGAITFPSASKLNDYAVSTPAVYPVMADDTVVTDTSSPMYLPDLSSRINVSENSMNSVTRYYFTKSATQNAKNIPSKSITYKISVTITPKVTNITSSPAYTLTRFVRCDKVSPFSWTTYRNGSCNYSNSNLYTGPMYIAGDVIFNGPTFTDSFLLTGTPTLYNATFTGGGYAAQVKQTSLLSVIPNIANNLAVDSSGNRQASFETSTSGTPDPSDMFSTREVIEPPNNPSNDTTPAPIRDARIYNQADVRIKVLVTTSGATKTVSKTVVNVDGTTVSAATNPWVTPLLAAVNVKTNLVTDPNAFIDRSRSTTAPIESTDIDVGALKTVIEANPSVFPTGIVYAWDATGLSGGTRPLTGIRLWNAGALPSGGLIVGSNDPIYLKGDFNTGTTLPSGYTIDSTPNVQPYSSNGMPANYTPSSDAQRTVSGYTIQPAGVFGDSVTELSNAWRDANSRNTSNATSTTINLVEGWTTMSANELRADDTYTDPAGRANPIWIENWAGARRSMSGEEFVNWHSKYGTATAQSYGGWAGDISYNPKATALKLNWGTVNFVRDRSRRGL